MKQKTTAVLLVATKDNYKYEQRLKIAEGDYLASWA